jgi:O-antigen/teichoic acid export membrane protein
VGIARTIAKNTAFNFIATASDVVINLVVGIVLARSLGTEQYGLYSLLMWFLTLALLAANLGLGAMATRYIAEAIGRESRDDPKSLIRLTVLSKSFVSVVVTLIIVFSAGFWAEQLAGPDDGGYFMLVAFLLIPNALSFTFRAIFAGFQKYEYSAYLMLGTNPLRAILVIALAVLGYGLDELLIANIVAWGFGALVGIFLLRRLVPISTFVSAPKLDSAITRRVLKYALSMTGVLVMEYLLWHQAEVFFIGLYRPVEEVGFYTLAYKLPSMLMLLIPSVFGIVLLPAIAEQFGRGDMQKLRSIYSLSARYLMILALPLAAAGIALARPIMLLLYGVEYEPSILIMQILFIPFATRGISHAAVGIIKGTDEPSILVKVDAVLVLVGIALNIWLIPIYHLPGAAIASSIPRLISLPLYIHFASRKIGSRWPLKDTLKITFAAVVTGVVLFVLQHYLSIALSLALAIPAGIAIYVTMLLVLRLVNTQDLAILIQSEQWLPRRLRKGYSVVINVVATFVRH